jgi:hypothetical protein
MSDIARLSSVQQKKNLDGKFFDKSLFAEAAQNNISNAIYSDFKKASLDPNSEKKFIKAFRKIGIKIKAENGTCFYCEGEVPKAYLDELDKSTKNDRNAADFFRQRKSGTYRNDFDGNLVVIVNKHDIDVLSKKFKIPEEDNKKFREIIRESILAHERAHEVTATKLPKLKDHPKHEVIATYIAAQTADQKAAEAASENIAERPRQDSKDYDLVMKIAKSSASEVLGSLGENVANYDLANENQQQYAKVNFKFGDDRIGLKPQSVSETFEAVATRFFNSHIRDAHIGVPTILGGKGKPGTPDQLIKMIVDRYVKNLGDEAARIIKQASA